jgi:hypothetical protein
MTEMKSNDWPSWKNKYSNYLRSVRLICIRLSPSGYIHLLAVLFSQVSLPTPLSSGNRSTRPQSHTAHTLPFQSSSLFFSSPSLRNSAPFRRSCFTTTFHSGTLVARSARIAFHRKILSLITPIQGRLSNGS